MVINLSILVKVGTLVQINRPTDIQIQKKSSYLYIIPEFELNSMSLNKNIYKIYCFQHQANIMFFTYNSNHPIMAKNYKFQLGKVKIFANNGHVYSCQITSNPHLNVVLDWNQEYFAKLFHGLSLFQLEGSGDEYDDTFSLIVRDHFEKSEEIFLMRAKLADQYGYDITNQFWNCFKNYNIEKIKIIEAMNEENSGIRDKADGELSRLIQLQQQKDEEKRRLKGRLSALLREKEAKLKQFNQNFKYFNNERQIQPSVDLPERGQSLSIAGSLFQQSQDFMFYNQ